MKESHEKSSSVKEEKEKEKKKSKKKSSGNHSKRKSDRDELEEFLNGPISNPSIDDAYEAI